MFQYAFGLNLARKNNTELLLDTVFLADRLPRREFTYRTFALDVFRLEPRFTRLSTISGAIPVPGLWLAMDLTLIKLRELLQVSALLKEKHEPILDLQALQNGGNALVWGFWHSEKYFADVADEIRKEFQLKNKLSGDAARIGEKVSATNSVSLHVRRRDYVNCERNKRETGETDVPYYNRAAFYVAERVTNLHFYVFSDDIAWCEENLHLAFPTTYVGDGSAGPKGAFHLQLMSLCKHNIIASSTFSWWSAWLNQNPGKIVVAPERWRPGSQQIVPQRWIKIAS